MKNWLLSFLALTSFVFGGGYQLKERLDKARPGDYIVTEANKLITILTVRSISPESLVIEEITAPSQNLKKHPVSWPEWVKAKAPGHTSWSMIEIDRVSGKVSECYSFSRSSWIRLTQQESLFATLLNLPMNDIPKDKRRKIGPPPMAGEPDVRKSWAPPLIREGEKIETARFDVYQTLWPEDGTEIAGREVALYFDANKQFPFPFWVQAETTHATATLRTIDSGKNLPIVYRELPRRVPEFVGTPLKTEKGLSLSLKSPSYYREFDLFAVDVTTREKEMCPINHSLVKGEQEWLTVEIEKEELEKNLAPNHRYTWLLVPANHTESYTETLKPFTWLP